MIDRTVTGNMFVQHVEVITLIGNAQIHSGKHRTSPACILYLLMYHQLIGVS